MSETWLSVDGSPSVKVVLKQIGPYRGVGVTRLLFTFEVTCKQSASVGSQLWLGGRVEIQNLPANVRLYLASFLPPTQPVVLPQLGSDATLQISLDVSERQVQLIEDNRTAGVEVSICLSGYGTKDGQHLVVPEGQIYHDIGQSEWITLLGRIGYRRPLLLELEPPDPQAHPELAQAIDFYLQAQHRYQEGEWRTTVENLRQVLASLVGKKADDEEQEVEVQTSIKALRNEARSVQVAYEPRLELVRQAAKFMCDLGAHPEVAETRRHHAYGALVLTGGLLHAFTGA